MATNPLAGWRRAAGLACVVLGACSRAAPAPVPGATAALTLLAGHPGGRGSADASGAGARFFFPGGLAWDGARHLYVADSLNDVVRRVDLESGAVETVAGRSGEPGKADGRPGDTRLHHPSGLAWDGAGHLFIADAGNASIRRLDVGSGQLTTPKLDGAAFATPSGLAFAAGQLFIADEQASAVWRATANGTATLIAGQAGSAGEADGPLGTGRLRGPEGVAVDPSGQYLYIADAGGHSLRRLDLDTGKLETLATRLGQPRGLAFDTLGHLYIGDALDETVRRVDLTSGALFAVAGGGGRPGGADGDAGEARFSGPAALAFAGGGRLAVADAYTVRLVDSATGHTRTLAGRSPAPGSTDGIREAAFREPHGLAVDPQGRLYVADSANSAVRRVDPATGAVQTLAGRPGQPASIDGVGTAARFGRPLGLAADSQTLYVADPWEHAVRRVDLSSRNVTTLAGGGTGEAADGVGISAHFCGPVALALDGAGHLFVADHPYQDESAEDEGEDDDDGLQALLGRDRPGCSAVRRVELATGNVTTFAGSVSRQGASDGTGAAARFEGPMGLACDGRFLYVADFGGATVRRIDLTTQRVETLAGRAGSRGSADGPGPDARFGGPVALALDGAGALFVADRIGSTVRRLDLATRSVTTLLGRPGQAGLALGPLSGLNEPSGLAYFGGRLFVGDAVENAILVSELAGR